MTQYFLLIVTCFTLIAAPWFPLNAMEYTRFGAQKAGNITGDIPAFQGNNNLECPKEFEKGDFHPDPFKGEAPLFRIDHLNFNTHRDRLSAGQIERFKKNLSFFMNIYPTHRIMDFPEPYLAATEKNLKTARLDSQNALTGYNGGLPFPFPKNGYQAAWNLRKQWAGPDLVTEDCRRIVSPSGKIRKERYRVKIMAFDQSRILGRAVDNPDEVSGKTIQVYTHPPDKKGTAFLSISYMDNTRENDFWYYLPKLRMVRRLTGISKGYQSGGESTADETGFGYGGPINDFTWKLLGKKEIYVPANNYNIWQIDALDDRECLPNGINPALIRYELHRVWVLEGQVAEGVKHPYSKRVLYLDEDHWCAVAGENYDQSGNLWRVSEYYHCYGYCDGLRYLAGYMYLNLESGRYEVTGGCRTKNTRTNMANVGLEPEEFTIQALRRIGR